MLAEPGEPGSGGHCLRSHLEDHETVVIRLPDAWDGTGNVTATLTVASRLGYGRWLRRIDSSDFFYSGRENVRVRGTRVAGGPSVIVVDVPHFTMQGIGLGSQTEPSGVQRDASLRGTVRSPS